MEAIGSTPAGGRLKKEGSGAKGTDQKSHLQEEGQSKERGWPLEGHDSGLMGGSGSFEKRHLRGALTGARQYELIFGKEPLLAS